MGQGEDKKSCYFEKIKWAWGQDEACLRRTLIYCLLVKVWFCKNFVFRRCLEEEAAISLILFQND